MISIPFCAQRTKSNLTSQYLTTDFADRADESQCVDL